MANAADGTHPTRMHSCFRYLNLPMTSVRIGLSAAAPESFHPTNIKLKKFMIFFINDIQGLSTKNLKHFSDKRIHMLTTQAFFVMVISIQKLDWQLVLCFSFKLDACLCKIISVPDSI